MTRILPVLAALALAWFTLDANPCAAWTVVDLGVLSGGRQSMANAINTNGWVVGQSTLGNGDTHAFLYNGAGVMQDLNTVAPAAGWVFQNATGISDNGYIVGYGLYNGVTHGFCAHTPEPDTISLLITAVIGMLAHRWHKWRG